MFLIKMYRFTKAFSKKNSKTFCSEIFYKFDLFFMFLIKI